MFFLTRVSLFVIELVLCFYVLFGSCLVVSSSAIECLERLVPEMTGYVSSEMLSSTHCSLIPNYGPKTKFKMATAAILNLLPVDIFDIYRSRLSTGDFNHHTKFRANISIGG